MVLFVIIVIIVAIVIIKKKRDEKWYDELSINEKTKIRQLNIRLKEINVKQHEMLPQKYSLYKFIYRILSDIGKDEEIIFFSSYRIRVEDIMTQNGPGGYIYITNKKVLLKDKQNQHLPLEKISSVTFNKNGIIIHYDAGSIKLLGIPKKDIQEIINDINRGMENHKNISININQTTEKDVSDKIARLKALYDEGILTEYEFNVKKMELLEKTK